MMNYIYNTGIITLHSIFFQKKNWFVFLIKKVKGMFCLSLLWGGIIKLYTIILCFLQGGYYKTRDKLI
jgi:hypothetical protein